MSRRDLSYLTDILEAAKQIHAFVNGVDKEQYDGSSLIQSAVMRQIEIIGEATKRLSEPFRTSHPVIPWKQMAGMRDILIHAYDHVDIDEVWNVTQAFVPDLIGQVESLISTMSNSD